MAYNRERAERITALSVPVLLAAACYLNTLQNGFVYDDRFIVVNSPIITDLSLAGVFRIFGYISPNHYLPVRYLSYAVDYSLWGLNPFGFHFTNVVLHCVNALLVTLLTARLAGVTGGGRRSWIIAGIAGALFAVHPINTETVAWVTGRKDLLATAFTLSAIITYLKSYDEKRRFKTDWYLPASVLLFVSAVLSKASVIAFPLVLVALEIFVRPGAKHRVKHSAALRLAPFFIVDFIITFMDMKLSVDSGLIKAYMGGTPLFHYMTICKIPLLYLGKLLYPVRLSVEYSAVPERSVFSLMFVASLIFWAAVAVWFWAKRRTGGFAIFFTAWAILNLGPFMNVLPTSKLIADRYAYLPAIGVFALAGWCAARYAAGRGVAAKVVIVLLLVPITVLLGCRTISRNRDWNNEFSLWKASYALEPKNGIVLHNLGFAYYEKGDFATAERFFREAIKRDPSYINSYINLGGLVYYMKKDSAESMLLFRRALEINPRNSQAIANMAVIYFDRGDYGRAIAAMEKAIKFSDDGEMYVARLLEMKRRIAQKELESGGEKNEKMKIGPLRDEAEK